MINVFKYIDKIPQAMVRHRILDSFIEFFIPFSRWLGLKIQALSIDKVIIHSPERRRRRNHVGGAHACALALLGEYAAGLLLAQRFAPDEYRMIIGSLNINYQKQGRGLLIATSLAPNNIPQFAHGEISENGEIWVDMTTEITNAKTEHIATCKTRWQIKAWDQIRKH